MEIILLCLVISAPVSVCIGAGIYLLRAQRRELRGLDGFARSMRRMRDEDHEGFRKHIAPLAKEMFK